MNWQQKLLPCKPTLDRLATARAVFPYALTFTFGAQEHHPHLPLCRTRVEVPLQAQRVGLVLVFPQSVGNRGVYWFVFGVVYRAVPPGTSNGNAENFGLYLFTGLVIWTLFTGLVDGSMEWLSSVSDLRKKIYFPTETALLGGAASNLVQST